MSACSSPATSSICPTWPPSRANTLQPVRIINQETGSATRAVSPIGDVRGGSIYGGVAINHPNTELEPWVARNPLNPDNQTGAFQQDRWSDGGAKGLVASWSFNDGLKWGVTALPFSKCALPYYGGAPCPPTQGVASPV